MNYAAIIVTMALLPIICGAALFLYRTDAKENKKRNPAVLWQDAAVLALSEAALFALWLHLGRCTLDHPIFVLSYVMLAGISVFCITDLRDRTVPNRLLLILLLCWAVIAGFFVLRSPQRMMGYLAEYITGFLFCTLSFGLCYILTKGKLGAGDVKLAFVMGLYLPGSYAAAAVFYGCVLSAVFCLVLLFAKKITKQTTIPFVPFLYIGVIVKYIIG